MNALFYSARLFCVRRGYELSGYVIFHGARSCGWLQNLSDPPRNWVPGVLAVPAWDPHASQFLAVGGTDKEGAARWAVMTP